MPSLKDFADLATKVIRNGLCPQEIQPCSMAKPTNVAPRSAMVIELKIQLSRFI